MNIKIVGISDTHGSHESIKIPNGDILVIAGDFSNKGNYAEVVKFNNWLGTLPHKYKIVTAGNHDAFCFKNTHTVKKTFSNAIYLEHEPVTVLGINFFASPWTPTDRDWLFMYDKNGDMAKRLWDAIPDDTNIIITHGHPAGTKLGLAYYDNSMKIRADTGCRFLRKRIDELKYLRAVFHGHIHEGHGAVKIGNVKYMNVAVTDINNFVVNEATTFVY